MSQEAADSARLDSVIDDLSAANLRPVLRKALLEIDEKDAEITRLTAALRTERDECAQFLDDKAARLMAQDNIGHPDLLESERESMRSEAANLRQAAIALRSREPSQ